MWMSTRLNRCRAVPYKMPRTGGFTLPVSGIVCRMSPMAKKFHRFIWQFVIGLGFLSGLWTAVGIDPEGLLIAALGLRVSTISPVSSAPRTLLDPAHLAPYGVCYRGIPEGGRCPGSSPCWLPMGRPCDPNFCRDGTGTPRCGSRAGVLFDPETREVTHFSGVS